MSHPGAADPEDSRQQPMRFRSSGMFEYQCLRPTRMFAQKSRSDRISELTAQNRPRPEMTPRAFSRWHEEGTKAEPSFRNCVGFAGRSVPGFAHVATGGLS